MRVNFSLLEEPIEIEKATFLTIKDVQTFAHLVKLIYQYDGENELKLFDAQQKGLKPTELFVVTDILGYDVNSAATLKLIYGDLEAQLNDKPEVKSMIEKLTGTISQLIGYELLEHEMDLEEDGITVQELFKALGIKIETTSDTIFEKAMEITQVHRYLSKKKLLIFINACTYLTEDEVQQVVEYISLNNVDVLFLEQRVVQNRFQYILDENFYLSYEKA